MVSIFNTPEGVRDLAPSKLEEKLKICDRLLGIMKEAGYLRMQTPSFEYFDVFSREIGMTPSSQLYKFYDKEGNTLVLRPDFTPPMARAYSSLYHDETGPVKLCYGGNTFVNGNDLNGALKESTQVGAELYDDGSCEADAQMISLIVKCMKGAGFEDFIVSVGNVDFFRGLCEGSGIGYEDEAALWKLISSRSKYKAQDFLRQLGIDDRTASLFTDLSDCYNTRQSLLELSECLSNEKCVRACRRLIGILDILEAEGIGRYISVDLGLLNKYDYYTGVIFRAYTYGFGDAVIKGGRYDNLVKEFGKDVPAIGFGISIDELMMALTEQKSNSRHDNGYLTFALTKGRLASQTMDILEKIGITCEEMRDTKTRKLIFVNEELKLKFFLAKGPDVPTYVEHGVADIGVVGKDTIDEEDRSILEVLDLGFGKCRMCVCGPKEAASLLAKKDMIKIATKYPRIAKNYFVGTKHQTVDIIKLNGSIELAPIVGLSDCIVDIVETGSTLRENGLGVLEEIYPLSARMVVNPVSMRLMGKRVNELIGRIKEVL